MYSLQYWLAISFSPEPHRKSQQLSIVKRQRRIIASCVHGDPVLGLRLTFCPVVTKARRITQSSERRKKIKPVAKEANLLFV